MPEPISAPTSTPTAVTTTAPAKLPAKLSDKPKRSLKVTGKLKLACELMVFGPEDGDNAGIALLMDEAALKAGMTTRAIRKALDKPHVRQFLSQQKQVFRASASAQNISRLVTMRDKSENAMAQLGAIRILEQDDEQAERKAAARTPGITIQIINQGPRDANALKTIDTVPNEQSERIEAP